MPDGFTIERIAGPELLSYPMFGVQDDRGRLFVFESTEPNTMTTEEMLAKPSYHIGVLEDVDGDGTCDRSTSPALFEPECRTPRQMQLANALCRFGELATLVPPGPGP